MGTETHTVLCVLEGPVPEGRVYTELESHEIANVVEALDDWLDSLANTRKDLEGKELDIHDEFMEEVAGTLEKFREYNK